MAFKTRPLWVPFSHTPFFSDLLVLPYALIRCRTLYIYTLTLRRPSPLIVTLFFLTLEEWLLALVRLALMLVVLH